MAFTKTPMDQAEQTKQIDLMYQWETRNYTNAYDTDAVNVIYEPVQNNLTGENYYEVLKRDGIIDSGISALFNNPNGEIIVGIYAWSNRNLVIIQTAQRVYGYSPINGTMTFSTVNVIGQPTYFTEFLFEDGTVQVIGCTNNNLYMISQTGTLTNLQTAPNVPLTHGNRPVFMDGYLFINDNKGAILNSNVNDPTTWSASAFVTAESYPDAIICIARQGLYIVAFGAGSIEYFYDAGNPTGSPLSRYQVSVPQIGYMGGLCSLGDTLYFSGVHATGKPSLFSMTGLKLTELGSNPLTRYQQSIGAAAPALGRQEDGAILEINGHNMYVWNIVGTQLNGVAFTYMIDVDTKLFTRITSPIPQSLLTTYPNFFPIAQAQTVFGANGVFGLFFFTNERRLYQFDAQTYQDTGLNFTASMTTPMNSFGNRRKKFISRVMLDADTTPSPSYAYLSYSGDDYQTFSTPRPIRMDREYKQTFALGDFRDIAFKLTYSDNFPMRFHNLEMDYLQGL